MACWPARLLAAAAAAVLAGVHAHVIKGRGKLPVPLAVPEPDQLCCRALPGRRAGHHGRPQLCQRGTEARRAARGADVLLDLWQVCLPPARVLCVLAGAVTPGRCAGAGRGWDAWQARLRLLPVPAQPQDRQRCLGQGGGGALPLLARHQRPGGAALPVPAQWVSGLLAALSARHSHALHASQCARLWPHSPRGCQPRPESCNTHSSSGHAP